MLSPAEFERRWYEGQPTASAVKNQAVHETGTGPTRVVRLDRDFTASLLYRSLTSVYSGAHPPGAVGQLVVTIMTGTDLKFVDKK